jgi:hypothetical protein
MHDRLDIHNIVIAVIFSGLGILFPVLFHLLGLGSMFLPMYIPLAAGSFMLSRRNALMAGVFTPLVSALVTGMPPLYPPIAPLMAVQLGVFCFLISSITHGGKMNYARPTHARVLVTLAAALLAERIVMLALFNTVMPLAGMNTSLFALYELARGLPGVILILAVVPLVVPRSLDILERHSLRLYEHRDAVNHDNGSPSRR